MESLSDELAGLPHPERMQRVMRLGQRAREGSEEREQLRMLAVGGTFERWLAVKSCYMSGDGALVLAGVQDPSLRVRAASRKLVALACDDAQAFEALKVVFATRQHQKMLMALRKRRRTAPIDLFLDWLREQPGETLFSDLVPLGSPAGIERHLDKALERAGFVFWARMKSYAPGSLARLLCAQVGAQPGHPDGRLRWLLDTSLSHLADQAPDETLALWALLRERGVPAAWRAEGPLLRRRPGEMVDRMLGGVGSLAKGCFAAVAHELGAERLLRVLRHDATLLGPPALWLEKLPPGERRAAAAACAEQIERQPEAGASLLAYLDEPARERAFVAWSYASRDSDGVIGLGEVARLPGDLAEREAKRHLTGVTQLATRPAARLPYAELLPWEEARAALRDHMGHPEGDVRGPAVATLLRAAGRQRGRPELIGEALGMVTARKNEQDPVRARMIEAILGWPREAWRAEHLAAAGQIVRDGLDAADLSYGSARLLEDLVLRLFHLDGAWGARWLTTLARERGQVHTSRLGDLLSDAQVQASAASLLELARAWAERERDGHLMNLCHSLGARITLVPGLCELLEGVLVSSSLQSPSLAIMALLYRHDRPRYERLLPPMLGRWQQLTSGQGVIVELARYVDEIDEALAAALGRVAEEASSVGVVEGVLRLLRSRRKDVFFALGPRLLALDPSYILAPSLLWLAHRRRQDLLTPYLRGELVHGRFATGKTAWVLPVDSGFERWSPPQHALYAEALGSVTADRQRDTPTICWAIGRLERLCYSSGAQLIALADDERAAVQDMGIRALARLDAGQGVPTLLACMDDARARVAIYALRGAILSMPPASAAGILRRVPRRKVSVLKEVTRLLGELRTEEAFQALLDIGRSKPHRDVRVALLRALWDHLEREETWEIFRDAALGDDWILASRVGDIPPDRLSDRSERRLSELLARVLDRPEPEARIDLLRRAGALPIRDHERHFYRGCLRRMESRYDDEINAAVQAAVARATERDVPALAEAVAEVSLHRKVLQRVLASLVQASERSSVAREACRRALSRMADDALLVGLYAQTAPRVLSLDELLAALDRVASRGWLDEFPQAALAPLGALAPSQVEPFELALAAHPHYALRLAALAALQASASARGWTPELRERLDAFQRDASPRVAIAAQFIFPPAEEPPRTP